MATSVRCGRVRGSIIVTPARRSGAAQCRTGRRVRRAPLRATQPMPLTNRARSERGAAGPPRRRPGNGPNAPNRDAAARISRLSSERVTPRRHGAWARTVSQTAAAAGRVRHGSSHPQAVQNLVHRLWISRWTELADAATARVPERSAPRSALRAQAGWRRARSNSADCDKRPGTGAGGGAASLRRSAQTARRLRPWPGGR